MSTTTSLSDASKQELGEKVWTQGQNYTYILTNI